MALTRRHGVPVMDLLRNDFQPLYAILDGARDIQILVLLLQSKEQYQSLYECRQAAKLAHVAPYVVRLPKYSPVLESWSGKIPKQLLRLIKLSR